MKLLVCTDGSEQSKKAMEKALEIASGCKVGQVTLINVYEKVDDLPPEAHDRIPITKEDVKMIKQLRDHEKEDRRSLLEENAEYFKKHNIQVDTMAECGHPAEVITRVANDGNYDMIVIGSRGLGGLKKLLLGSVSNSVLQEAKSSVLVVK